MRIKFVAIEVRIERFHNKNMSNKGALALLMEYDDGSSDDEVPGCRVSTKRTHKDDSDEPNSKRLARLPLPSFALNTQNAQTHLDDPQLHEGKVRSFPHERGNWATYLYIPYEFNEALELLLSGLHMLPAGLRPKPINDLHFSLSRTVILKHHWIDMFVQAIKRDVACCTKFLILFGQFNVYCNEERTRTFLGIEARTGYDSLNRIVQIIDRCFGEFNLEPFYKDPSFHMSIAWWLGDHEQELASLLPKMNQHLEATYNSFPDQNWSVYVQSVFCKTGNKTFEFHLR